VPARPRGNAWARFATWAGAALAPLLLAAFLSAELTASFAVDTIKIGTPAGGFDFEPALAVVWFAAALLASPGLWTLLRRLAAAVSTLAHALVPAGIHGATEAELVAAALEGAVALAITAVVAFGILALRAALPPLPTLAIAFASAFLVAAALRRPLDALRRNLERAVGALSGDPSPPRNREDLLRALREGYPWGVEIETVTVPANALGAGQSLADLGLRQRTGASVVAIERRGERLLSPGPLSRLEPGDIIVLLGTHDQVQAARERIREALDVPLVGNPDFAVEPVVVAGDSRLVGKRLAEARIRESSGALVVGWQQPQGEPVPNPPPDTLLGEGDLLLLLGTPDQVRRARERVTAGV
jgi:CPA2 family monovalent cation:H+ antiporter-2